MIDIQQRALSSFKENIGTRLTRIVENLGDIGLHWQQCCSPLFRFSEGGCVIDRVSFIVFSEGKIVVVDNLF